MRCYYCDEEIDGRYYIPESAEQANQTEVVYCEHCAVMAAKEEAEFILGREITEEEIQNVRETYMPINDVEFAELIEEEAKDIKKIEKAKEFLQMTDDEVEEIKELTGAKNNYELACELEKIILDMNKEVEDE